MKASARGSNLNPIAFAMFLTAFFALVALVELLLKGQIASAMFLVFISAALARQNERAARDGAARQRARVGWRIIKTA